MILYNVIESISLTMRALLLLLAFTKMVNVSFVIKHFPTNLYWYEVVLVCPIPERRMSYTKLRHHLLFRHKRIIFLLLHDSRFPFINVLRKCSCKRQSTFARKGQIDAITRILNLRHHPEVIVDFSIKLSVLIYFLLLNLLYSNYFIIFAPKFSA